jgi:hypothetical protein
MIDVGIEHDFIFDGTNWQILNPILHRDDTFPVFLNGTVSEKQLISLAENGCVIPATPPVRHNTREFTLYSQYQFVTGFIKLSEKRFLSVHNVMSQCMNVDFALRAAWEATSPFSWSAEGANETGYTPGTMSVIQDLYDNPERAALAGMVLAAGRIFTYVLDYNDENGTIKVGATARYAFATTRTVVMSNVASAGGSAARGVCLTRDGTTVYASLIEYQKYISPTEGKPTLIHEIALPLASVTAISYIGLYTIDKAAGRLVYLYRNGSNIFALPLTVIGDTLVAGTVQTLGTTGDMAVETTAGVNGMQYASAETDRYSGGNGMIVLLGRTGTTAHGGPMRMQILTVDESGIVTKGPVYAIPATVNPNIGTVSVTYKSPKRVLISALDSSVTPFDACVIDCEISGVTLVSAKKYRAFRSLGIPNTAAAVLPLRNYAIENPDAPNSLNEFLYLQQYDGSNGIPLDRVHIWFGNRYDNHIYNNIAGVALDNSANGRVRAQISPKYLPEFGSGYVPGAYYTLGADGRFTQLVSPASPSMRSGKKLAYAVNSADLYFFGPEFDL